MVVRISGGQEGERVSLKWLCSFTVWGYFFRQACLVYERDLASCSSQTAIPVVAPLSSSDTDLPRRSQWVQQAAPTNAGSPGLLTSRFDRSTHLSTVAVRPMDVQCHPSMDATW